MSGRLIPDSQGVSTIVGYTITLAITTLLVSGLLLAAGGFVQNQRERAVRGELKVIGQQIAADAQAGDRFVQAGDTDFTIERDLPDTVTGSEYTIEIVASDSGSPDPPYKDDTFVELRTEDPDIVVRVDFTVQRDIKETSFEGGELVVTYDTGSSALEVDDDA